MNDHTEAHAELPEDPEMTPIQEATRLKMLTTYQANLFFLQKEFPYVYSELMKCDPTMPFQIEPDGKVWVNHKSHQGYSSYFRELGKMQFDFFDNPQTRPRVITFTRYLADETLAAPHMTNPHFFFPVEPRFRFDVIRAFKELCPEPAKWASGPHFGERKLIIAVSFGVGYGHDLELIVENYELRHFVIVEPDIRQLDLSLYFLDYAALYHQFMYRGGKHFTILTSSTGDIKELAHDLLVTIRGHWPPYFARGVALHFNDYKSDDVKELWNNLSQDMFKLYAGWGFFDDEVLSLLHSAQNALRGFPLCVREEKKPVENAIAFVVGSGPSLDKLWPMIEEYRDRAVVICCGSAISAFMKKGIKPDFHIEIERTDFTYEFLSDERVRNFLQDVPLLFLSLIPPGCFNFSNKPMMILKDIDGGTQIIDIENQFPRFSTGPTVTNAGTDFALRMGFSEVYLFGVDVGYPKEGLHHSKMSFYYEDDHSTDNVKRVVEETHNSMKQTITVPGNFGDEVESTFIFLQCRDLIAQSIRIHGDDKKVYNLNWGAAIKNAEPLVADEVRISATPEDRQKSLARIAACFSLDYPHEVERNLGFLAGQLEAVHADVRDIFARPIKSKLDIVDALRDLSDYLFAKKHATTAVFPMLRGSLYHLCQFFFECMTLVPDDETAALYARRGFDVILAFLLGGREVILQIPDEARRRLAALDAGIPYEPPTKLS